MPKDVANAVRSALGVGVKSLGALSGGCVGEVYRAALEDGRAVVVKVDSSGAPRLDVEGYMLEYLATRSALPVPKVYHAAPELLIMALLPGESRFSRSAEAHAAELLAALHEVRGDRFGLERDTLIGGLHQPNPWTDSWVEFFRQHRLLYMAGECVRARRMGRGTLRRIERFCDKLDGLIEGPAHPSLLHGDVWTTNVLAEGDRITGFVDPAVYYGHPEIELAFVTLFGTFGDAFFRKYEELRGIRPGFFEVRRDIYNLYPLLVHVRLFGGGYLSGVERVLDRHGC